MVSNFLNLHFLDYWWCWLSFHVLVSHLFISYCEVSVKSFCPLLNGGCFYLGILSYIGYVIDISLSTYLCVAFSSQFVASLFIFLVVSLDEQKILCQIHPIYHFFLCVVTTLWPKESLPTQVVTLFPSFFWEDLLF